MRTIRHDVVDTLREKGLTGEEFQPGSTFVTTLGALRFRAMEARFGSEFLLSFDPGLFSRGKKEPHPKSSLRK